MGDSNNKDGVISAQTVRERLCQIRQVTTSRVHVYFVTGRIKGQKNPVHNRWETTTRELERFIKEDFSQIDPKGGRPKGSDGRSRKRN